MRNTISKRLRTTASSTRCCSRACRRSSTIASRHGEPLLRWAGCLAWKRSPRTMAQVLKEGKEFDKQMTRLAEEEVNPQMLDGKDEESSAGGNAVRAVDRDSSQAGKRWSLSYRPLG